MERWNDHGIEDGVMKRRSRYRCIRCGFALGRVTADRARFTSAYGVTCQVTDGIHTITCPYCGDVRVFRSIEVSSVHEENSVINETKDAVRLSVNITPEVAEAIQALARSRGITVSELVRDALATEKFLAEEQLKNKKVFLESEDGTRERLVFR